MQKLYCYVDESGQDIKSKSFVVVSVMCGENRDFLRRSLFEIEKFTKSGKKKWHKLRSEKRIEYLKIVLNKKIGKGDVYFGAYKKPIPYYFPIIETIEKSIKNKAKEKYTAIVYIDGIDRRSSIKITNALRIRGVSLKLVKSRRDESEPLIRLADMWAGCIRGALLGNKDNIKILEKAEIEQYLYDITNK